MWLEILNAIWNIFEDSLRIEFLVDNMLFWNQGKILCGVLNLKCIWLLEIYLERKCINKTEQEKKIQNSSQIPGKLSFPTPKGYLLVLGIGWETQLGQGQGQPLGKRESGKALGSYAESYNGSPQGF